VRQREDGRFVPRRASDLKAILRAVPFIVGITRTSIVVNTFLISRLATSSRVAAWYFSSDSPIHFAW
jgi:hypothetical protein